MRHSRDLVVSVQSLFFTQETIAVTFESPRHQERIDDAVDRINSGYLSPRAFPNMQVITFQGHLWSLSNRRLWVFKKACVPSITVTLVCNSHDGFHSRLTASPQLYSKLFNPGFFPRPHGYCKEIFTEADPDPAELPPPTPHARGGRRQVRVEMPTRIDKQSIPSAAPPHVRERPQRPKSSPPSKVAKFSGAKSKHSLHYDDFRNQQFDDRYHSPSQFKSQHLQQQTCSMRGSVVLPPSPGKCSPDGRYVLNTKRCHRGAEHDRHHSPRKREEACFPRPSIRQRPPSKVSEFKASSPDALRTPFQDRSSHPARRSTKNPARVRESLKALSPPSSRTLHQESEWPPYHTRELHPSMPKLPVPIPRDTRRAAPWREAPRREAPRVRLAKEARPPSPVRTRSSERRAADRPGNVPSIRIPERKAYDCNGQQPSLQRPRDRRQTDCPSVSKDIHSLRRIEAKSSTRGAGAVEKPSLPLAPAPKRSRSSRATSHPKNFSYDFHTSGKKPRASKGSKKAGAAAPTPSTECLSTQLPDHVPEVSVPSLASLKTQRASPEKPLDCLPSSSTTVSLSTPTKERQILDDNFTSDVIDPNENQGQPEPVFGMMSPTTKTRHEQEQEQEQEQEAPEIVDLVGKREFLSDSENNLFKSDVKQSASMEPKLAPPAVVLDFVDAHLLNEILQQLFKGESAALQKVHTKSSEDTVRKDPSVEAESPNKLPFQTPVIDVQPADVDEGATVQAGFEPAKVQASPPSKGVLEPQTEAKATSATDRQQEPTRVKDVVTLHTEANAGSAVDHQQANQKKSNKVPKFSDRITRSQVKKEQELERKKERQKRRELREAEKKKEPEVNSVKMKEKSVSSPKYLTRAIVPYDASRSKQMSKAVQTGDMAYVKVIGEIATIGVEGRSRQHPYLRFLGPFTVKRKFNAHAALLELPDDCCLKRSFSLNVLTKSRSPLSNYLPEKSLSIALVPETVLKKRVARRLRKRQVIHYLVKWKTLPATEATWEPETILLEHPHLLHQVDSPWFSNPYLLRNWKA